jgi:hypothetical protein
MAQQPTSPQDLTAFDHYAVAFPTRQRSDLPTAIPAQPAARTPNPPQVGVRRYTLRKVAIVEVADRLSEVVQDCDHAIQMALTERARGVICDVTAAGEGAEPTAVEALATAGRHVRDWPGVPLAVACPDPQVCEALRAHPLGHHLIVTPTLLSAMTAVMATRTVTVERLRLAPSPSAPRAAQDFVTRTLHEWRLSQVIPFASLVVSELVANATMDASADIDVSVAWDLGALRLAVRDDCPDLPHQPYSHRDPHGRRLSVVAVLSRTFGVLPTAEGGKVIWAVLEAPHRTW